MTAEQPRQEPPFAIQIELTLGCNLGCDFCGINGIGYQHAARGGGPGYKFMSPETATKVAAAIAEAGWNGRIEFARRGEPTMNPHAAEIVGIFRQWLPKASMLMLSNGGGLLPDPHGKIALLFAHGLNTLAVEDYDGVKLHQKVFAGLSSECRITLKGDGSFEVKSAMAAKPWVGYEYPRDPRGNPHTRRKPSERVLVSIQNIVEATRGSHSHVNNHGGYSGPLVDYPKPCSKPFREMSVNYDGIVTYCCINWGGEGRCGDLTRQSADEVWQSAEFGAVRRRLIRGQRDFLTCKGCDHRSERVALLPDKLGKQRATYPEPVAVADDLLLLSMSTGDAQPNKEYFKMKDEFQPK